MIHGMPDFSGILFFSHPVIIQLDIFKLYILDIDRKHIIVYTVLIKQAQYYQRSMTYA